VPVTVPVSVIPGAQFRVRSRPLADTSRADLDAQEVSYSIQPSCLMAQPAFQILVMWLILPSSNSIT
jgi:hypothetical protein